MVNRVVFHTIFPDWMCKKLLASLNANIFTPYFAGLLEIYCMKLQRPLNECSISLIVVYSLNWMMTSSCLRKVGKSHVSLPVYQISSFQLGHSCHWFSGNGWWKKSFEIHDSSCHFNLGTVTGKNLFHICMVRFFYTDQI